MPTDFTTGSLSTFTQKFNQLRVERYGEDTLLSDGQVADLRYDAVTALNNAGGTYDISDFAITTIEDRALGTNTLLGAEYEVALSTTGQNNFNEAQTVIEQQQTEVDGYSINEQDFDNDTVEWDTTNTTVQNVSSAGNPVQSVDFDDDGNIVTTFQDGSTQVQDEGGNIITTASTSALNSNAENISNNYNNSQNIQNPVNQPSVSELRGGTSLDDWRVRLRLAPQSDYLYNAPNPGILSPLKATDGIIFPYMPRLTTQHTAKYNSYDLPHSNYRGYFYTGSVQNEILITSMWTAQDTSEADYLLATLHFLRSCTKMFYGQDAQRGTPPPLVFLSGLGEYQFNEHPCAVSLVNINLPDNVDYIEAGNTSSGGTDFMGSSNIRSDKKSDSNFISSAISRLFGTGLSFGGSASADYPNNQTRSETVFQAEGYGKTRVPTKMEISFNLVPIQTRNQVSNEYSLKDYSNGSLLRKGFW